MENPKEGKLERIVNKIQHIAERVRRSVAPHRGFLGASIRRLCDDGSEHGGGSRISRLNADTFVTNRKMPESMHPTILFRRRATGDLHNLVRVRRLGIDLDRSTSIWFQFAVDRRFDHLELHGRWHIG